MCGSLANNIDGMLVHTSISCIITYWTHTVINPPGVNGLMQTLPLSLPDLNGLMQHMDDDWEDTFHVGT